MTVVSDLTSLVTAVAATPGGIGVLKRGMNQSQELQAVEVIDTMIMAGPTAAGNFLPQLSTLNLPADVAEQINQAVASGAADPAGFKADLQSAKISLLREGTRSTSIFGGLFG